MFSSKLLIAATAIVACQHIVSAQQMPPPPPPPGQTPPPPGPNPPPGPTPSQMTPATKGYFGKREYMTKTAAEKLNALWQQALAEKTDAPAPENYNLAALMKETFKHTFGEKGDELPPNILKFNHSQGVLAQITWEDLGSHAFTGLYKGNSQGLIRLSEGNFLVPEAPGLTPTFAMKFPRDGIESVNQLANTSFEPSTSFNFFAREFKNRIDFFQDPCAKQTIERHFLDQNPTPQSLGLAQFSSVGVNGKNVKKPNFPFQIRFVPHADVATLFSDIKELDGDGKEVPWYTQLKRIESGKYLFEVWARDSPVDAKKYPNSAELHIANIKVTSELITSTFGD